MTRGDRIRQIVVVLLLPGLLGGCELRSTGNPCTGGRRPGIVRCRSTNTPADRPEGYRTCVAHFYPYTTLEAGPYSVSVQRCSVEWVR